MTLSRSASRKLALPPQAEDSSFPSLRVSSSSRSTLASLFTTPSTPPRPPVSEKPNRKGRIYKGSRSEDLYPSLDPFSPPPEFNEFESSFAIQEYITCLVRRDPSDLNSICEIPIRREEDGEEVREVEVDLWIYEHLRRLVIDHSPWISALSTICTCPTMNASDWLFICAAHSSPPKTPSGACSALSYISHVSDGTCSLLNSSRYFPSRLSIEGKEQRGLLNAVARRMYRSFAHCYFEHGELFEELESETWVVRRLAELNRRFGLIEEGMLIIPDLGGEEKEGDGGTGDSEQDEEEEEEGGIRLVESPESEEEELDLGQEVVV